LDPIARSTDVVRRLVEAYQPERIYLFGSIARGDGAPDSDYDLLIIVPNRCVTRASSEPPCLRGPEGNGGAGWMRSSVRTIGSSQESICEPRCRGPCSARESCSMPHDPARVSDTKAWMRRAGHDLRAAAVDLAADPPVLDDLVFHCQQAVEKAMKSLLALARRAIREDSQPRATRRGLSAAGSLALKPLVERAVPLTRIRLEVPLSGEHEGATLDEAEHAPRDRQRSL